MLTIRKKALTLFVERGTGQWVVLDADGSFWILPREGVNLWDERQPYYPTVETELEPVPGHYKYMLSLPT